MTAAYELTKSGIEVDVYEASPDIGGMSKSINLWGQTVDIGPHRFFSKDRKVNNLWLELAGNDYVMVERLSRIYYKDRFFYYPLKPFNAFKKLGVTESVLSLISFLKEKFKKDKDVYNFEDWITKKFGKRLYKHFFKDYTEKLWGIPCHKLDKEFAIQRIKKLDLWEAVKNAFLNNKGKHRTLIDEFAYPLYGTGMIYNRMAEYIQQKGNKIYLNSPINKILVSNDKKVTGIELNEGIQKNYDEVISSMPITHLVRSISKRTKDVDEAVKKLRFRNTILVFLLIDSPNLFPDNWLYINSSKLNVGRIANFRNWSPVTHGNQDTTILSMEFWSFFDGRLWNSHNDQLISMASKELKATGLNKNASILDGYVYRIPRCYPIYEKGYKENLDVVKNFLDEFKGLQAIGRYGAFNYTNQDHSILMGILAARNLINDTSHDLWEINSEEQYQEDSRIGEEGVVN